MARVRISTCSAASFMDTLDDRFTAPNRRSPAILWETDARRRHRLHTEASSEKWPLWSPRGRTSETRRVPSADHAFSQAVPASSRGVGMSGDCDLVNGLHMQKEDTSKRFTRHIPSIRFERALGPATQCGIAADIDPDGLIKAIAPVRMGRLRSAVAPAFRG
jgi:2',3'-cyclic-nucleotide 2'-phosphodiesterase